MSRVRLDQRLVDLGLAADLKTANSLILSGKVLVNDQLSTKSGSAVALTDIVRFKSNYQPGRFVSRGGEKLWGVVSQLKLAKLFEHKVVLDVGASTGGFSDVALQLGAKHVYALDVGTNQLAWKLRQDDRVSVLEKTDIRSVNQIIDSNISLVLADISFNSISNLLEPIRLAVPSKQVSFLLLVKPQFELPSHLIPPGGVVTNESDQKKALQLAKEACTKCDLAVKEVVPSVLRGREGNQEFFFLLEVPYSKE